MSIWKKAPTVIEVVFDDQDSTETRHLVGDSDANGAAELETMYHRFVVGIKNPHQSILRLAWADQSRYQRRIKMKMTQARHGDVQLIKIAEMPEDVKKKEHLVLAYGEKTGHKHEVDLGELFETRDGKLFLKVDKLATVRHEEHETKPIEPGTYAIIIKRQYVADGGWAKVVD